MGPLKTTHLLRCPHIRNPHVLAYTLRLLMRVRLVSGHFLEVPKKTLVLVEVPCNENRRY